MPLFQPALGPAFTKNKRPVHFQLPNTRAAPPLYQGAGRPQIAAARTPRARPRPAQKRVLVEGIRNLGLGPRFHPSRRNPPAKTLPRPTRLTPFDPHPPCDAKSAADSRLGKAPFTGLPERPGDDCSGGRPAINPAPADTRRQPLKTASGRTICPCATDICGQYRGTRASVHLFPLVSCRRHPAAGATSPSFFGLCAQSRRETGISTFGAGSPHWTDRWTAQFDLWQLLVRVRETRGFHAAW
jgi:hypothetical protein